MREDNPYKDVLGPVHKYGWVGKWRRLNPDGVQCACSSYRVTKVMRQRSISHENVIRTRLYRCTDCELEWVRK